MCRGNLVGCAANRPVYPRYLATDNRILAYEKNGKQKMRNYKFLLRQPDGTTTTRDVQSRSLVQGVDSLSPEFSEDQIEEIEAPSFILKKPDWIVLAHELDTKMTNLPWYISKLRVIGRLVVE